MCVAGLDVPLVHSHSDSDTSEEESESEPSHAAAAPQRSLRPRGGGSGPPRGPAAARQDSLSESLHSGGGMAAAAVLLGASRGDAVGGPLRGGGGGGEPAHPRHAAGLPDSKHASSDRCDLGPCTCCGGRIVDAIMTWGHAASSCNTTICDLAACEQQCGSAERRDDRAPRHAARAAAASPAGHPPLAS